MRVSGDVAKFRTTLDSEPDRFRSIADAAKAAGAIHHRFGVGDDFVVIVDEWQTAEAFQTFFQTPEIAQIMADSGAQGEPEITVTEAISSPDQF
jgi:heme-degrading monooxygenase HmoA